LIQKTNIKAYKVLLKANNTTGNRTIKSETKRADDPQVSCQIECRMIQTKIGYIGKCDARECKKQDGMTILENSKSRKTVFMCIVLIN
jgi:hypothetical protein